MIDYEIGEELFELQRQYLVLLSEELELEALMFDFEGNQLVS